MGLLENRAYVPLVKFRRQQHSRKPLIVGFPVAFFVTHSELRQMVELDDVVGLGRPGLPKAFLVFLAVTDPVDRRLVRTERRGHRIYAASGEIRDMVGAKHVFTVSR